MRRRLLTGALLAVATTLWPPPSQAAGSSQVAYAEDGLFAQGHIDLPDADGSTRRLEVTLGIPRGAVTGSSSLPAVDLRRPWAAATKWGRDGARACSAAANPTAWHEGGLSADGRTWGGTSVDIACDDGAGFLFYRMTWEPGPFWLVTNPVATSTMGGSVTSWSAGSVGGTVALRPRANEHSIVVVCGHRAEGTDCFGGATGWGVVIPSVDGMAVQASTS